MQKSVVHEDYTTFARQEVINNNQLKKLLLLRHAEALGYADSLKDIDRELSHHGHQQAATIATYLDDNYAVIDKALVSLATRTQQTSTYIKNISEIENTQSLYEASLSDILKIICNQSSNTMSVLIIGHNPTLSFLASSLSQEHINIPTAGLVEFALEISKWNEVMNDEIKWNCKKIFLQ
jgi:phosphohistidine phosphatase